MSYSPRFSGSALHELQGLPAEAFDAMVARIVDLVDAPWDAVVAAPGGDQAERETFFGSGRGLLRFRADDDAETVEITHIVWTG